MVARKIEEIDVFSREEETTGQGRETTLAKKKGKTSEIRIPPDVPKPHVISRDRKTV